MSRSYQGVIFDMDGVLADSEPVYFQALNTVLAVYGKSITAEQHRQTMAHGVQEAWTAIIGAVGLHEPIDNLIAAYDAELVRALPLIRQALPGVEQLIQEIRGRGIPIGLASSSLPQWIDGLLSGIGLLESFDAKVSASMVARTKPAPDIYLLAAQRIGVEPERCIAIEDTPTGLKAARAAGMLATQVRSASTAFPPLPEADLVLDSLLDFDLSLLDAGRTAN